MSQRLKEFILFCCNYFTYIQYCTIIKGTVNIYRGSINNTANQVLTHRFLFANGQLKRGNKFATIIFCEQKFYSIPQ